MNQQNRQSACPDKVALSVWVDSAGDAAVASHLDQCAACRQTVGSYQGFNQALRKSARPQADLAGRIWQACQTAPAAAPLPVMAFPLWMQAVRIAAAVLIVGAVTGVVFVLGGPDRGKVTLASLSKPDAAAPTAIIVAVPRERMYIPFATPGAAYAATSPGGLDATTLARVSTTDSDSPLTALPSSLGVAPVVLANSVRHVWVVSDVAAAEREFLGTLPENATPLCTNRKDRAASFKVILSDRQLQQLVNRMEDAGWALVSPSLPQPGEEGKLLVTGKEVLYVVDLVAR